MNIFTITYEHVDNFSTHIANITRKYNSLVLTTSTTPAEIKLNYVKSHIPANLQFIQSISMKSNDDNVYFIKCTLSDMTDEHHYICDGFNDLKEACGELNRLQKIRKQPREILDDCIKFSILYCTLSCNEKVRIKSELDVSDLKNICNSFVTEIIEEQRKTEITHYDFDEISDFDKSYEKPIPQTTKVFSKIPEVMSTIVDFFMK